MAALRERMVPTRTASHPVLPRLVRKHTKQLVRQQASLDSVLSPDHTPEHVVIETVNSDGNKVIWKVFITEVGGTKTLDLYCGWSQESWHKRPPLTQLPPEVGVLSGLQRLWASHNLLYSLPHTLTNLTHLCELFLHKNKFTEFPTIVCQLPSLTILWLSHNEIPSIPDDITNLSLLRRLHLDYNQISVFPGSLVQLSNLEVLYLNNNSLQGISDDIGQLTSLRHLLLQYNQISELPRGLADLTDLERLDLSCNQLKHLSKEFKSFQAERNSRGARVMTAGNPLDSALTRMTSADQTSPVLRPRTMSFPLAGHMRRKSDSVTSPSPSPSPRRPRRHVFLHSHSEDQF